MLETPDVTRHLPLKAIHHLILLLLAERPTYGLELLERLEERAAGTVRMNAGSLYRTIGGLVDDGLIEPTVSAEPSGGALGAPKKLYAVTELGGDVLRAEVRRQADLVAFAEGLDLLQGER